tara:strand:- start:1121 stop:2995 length:1875 start_codon:yes stop_codon:yes gene_type:complete
MDKTLLRPLFQKRFMELHKPVKAFEGLFAQKQDSNQNMQVANLMPDASAPIVDVEKKELSEPGIFNALKKGFDESAKDRKERKSGIMSVIPQEEPNSVSLDAQFDIPKNEIQSRILQDKKVVKETQELGKQADQQPGLFSDGEKRGIFAANVAIALAQPGDFFSNLSVGLGKGALTLADLNVQEQQIINEQKKLGKADFYYDTVLGKTYKVEDKRAMTDFIQDKESGQMVPRFVKEPSKSKSDNTILKKLVFDKKTNKYVEKEILRSHYAEYLDGDFSKYAKGYIKPLPEDDVARVVLEDSIFGKKNQKIYVSKEVARNNKDILGADVPPEDKFLLEQQAIYFTDEQKAFRTALNKARDQARKSDRAIYLVKDLSERLDFGAKGGVLNSISQGIEQMKSVGGFLVGFDSNGNEKRVQLTSVGKDVLYDPNKAENFRDVELAFTNPEEYIDKMTSQNKMTAKEKRKFRESMGLFSKEFAKLNAGLQSNVIQLAYAIAKANEEGGRFSVSDIQFAMDSIGAGTSEDLFKSKLNTVAQRLATNAYQQYNDVFDIYKDFDLDFIQDRLELERGTGLYQRTDQNYNYYTRGEDYIRELKEEKDKKIKDKTRTIKEILEDQKKNEDKDKN